VGVVRSTLCDADEDDGAYGACNGGAGGRGCYILVKCVSTSVSVVFDEILCNTAIYL
jgi:hypothetical protein